MAPQARKCESYRHVQVSGVFEAAVTAFLAPLESEAVTVIHAGCTIQRTPHPRKLLVVVQMQLVLTLVTTASTNVGRACGTCGTPGARKPSPIHNRPKVRTQTSK